SRRSSCPDLRRAFCGFVVPFFSIECRRSLGRLELHGHRRSLFGRQGTETVNVRPILPTLSILPVLEPAGRTLVVVEDVSAVSGAVLSLNVAAMQLPIRQNLRGWHKTTLLHGVPEVHQRAHADTKPSRVSRRGVSVSERRPVTAIRTIPRLS